MRYSKIIVAIVIILNILFTSSIFYISYQNGNEVSDELINRWFDFTCLELLTLGGLKITEEVSNVVKDRNKKKYDKLSENDVPNESDKG